MKILTVVCGLGIGGTERTAENFSIGLMRCGYDVKVYASSEGGERAENLRQLGIEVMYSYSELHELKNSGWTPDVIHLHSLRVSMEAFMLIHNLFPGARIYEQNVFCTPTKFTPYLSSSLQLSQWCLWYYSQFPSTKRVSKTILPNAINVSNFYPCSLVEREDTRRSYGIAPDDFVLLRVGQPYNGKWNHKIIDVFIDFHKKYPRALLWLVGASPSVVHKISRLPNKSVKNRILLTDKLIGDEKLRLCYGASDVFLHMARIGETFGIVLAEAILCGLPVVTHQTPYSENSQAEVVGHLRGGLVANRYGGIIAALERLYLEPEFGKKLAITGATVIKERYSIQSSINLFQSIMRGEVHSWKYVTKDLKIYLRDAIDAPIPGILFLLCMKKVLLYVVPDKYCRLFLRVWCRLFCKAGEI